jgi:MFS-type transporter involved in bile tolerance (Atg22 family)
MLGFFQDLTGNSRTGLYFMAGFFFLAAVLAFFASQHASRVQRATEIAKQDMCCKPVLD